MYAIDAEAEVGEAVYNGDCTVDDMLDLLTNLTADPAFLPHYSLITDIRNSRLRFQQSDLPGLSKGLDEIIGPGTKKSAILVDSSRATAIAMLYQMRRPGGRRIELFSTRAAALAWIEGGI